MAEGAADAGGLGANTIDKLDLQSGERGGGFSAWTVVGQADRQRWYLALQAPDLLAQRPGQTELIQRGWPQPVHDAPDIGDRPLRLRL